MRITKFFLFIVLLLGSVSAQDFNAFGDLTVHGTPCELTTANITIQNTRDAASTYTLSVDGEASDYVTFSAINFALEPQQSAIINTFYNVPCDTRPGTYQTDLYFADEEIEQVLTQEVIITIPDNINATITETSRVTTPCETAAYRINLHNPLSFIEIYDITAKGHENAHISEKTIVLQPNERKDLIISVTPDDCTQSGTFTLTTTIQTDKSNQKEEVNLELIIKSTDIPILAEGLNRIRTDYQDSTAEFTLQNTGDRTTQYSLTLDGIDWGIVQPSTVSLNPGETKTLQLRLAPTEEIPTGTYTTTLTATVEQTGIQYSKDITIKLQPPTFIEKNPLLAIIILIAILALLTGAYFTAKYTRTEHYKTLRQKIKAKINNWKQKRAEKLKQRKQKREEKKRAREQKHAEQLKKKLEQQKRELERKQAEREKIKKKLQKQIEKEYKKQNYIVSKKDLTIGKSSKNTSAIIFTIILLAVIALTWQIILPNIAYVLVGAAILAAIYIAHKLSRQTKITAKWKLLMAKTGKTIKAWKNGLNTLEIESNEAIENFKIQIKKIKPRAPSPHVYQTIQIKTNTKSDLSYGATFSIPKKWAENHTEIKLAKNNKQNWQTTPIQKTGESKTHIHYKADLKTGTYTIYSKETTKHTTKMPWLITGVVLIIAAIILLTPQQASKGIPPQTWKQDTTHSIDLSKYFTDPDGDKLTYSATETQNIIIDITDNTAHLTPKTGWTGEEQVKFMADDGKEGKMTSNTVPLRVKANVISPNAQAYTAIALGILALLILALASRTSKKRK